MVASMNEIMARLEGYAPVATPTSYAHHDTQGTTSAPLPAFFHPQYPSSLKDIDINKKQGRVSAYLTVYRNDDGTPFVDPYQDIIEPGSFTQTIADLDRFRKSVNNPWLCPSLWQHNKNELIGGVARLSEDSKGVIYETQLAMGIKRAQEALELAEMKAIGSSYGYDPVGFNILPGNIRQLTQIGLREQSFVSFPANPLGQILDVKNRFTSYPTYPQQSHDAPSIASLSVRTLVKEMTMVGKPLKPSGEVSISSLVAEMQKIGPSGKSPNGQKSDYTFHPVPGSNACLRLNPDDSVSLLNCDGISSDTAVALALALLRLDDFLDSFEPQPDSQYAPTTEGDIMAARRIWDMKADLKWRKRKAEEAKRPRWG